MSTPVASASSGGGRVLATDPSSGQIVLLIAGATTTVACADAQRFRPGDAVRLTPDGPQRVWAHPTGEWPPSGSDALRLMQGDRWTKLRRRARVMSETRAFFNGAGFLEVETPAVVPSAGTEVHLDPVEAQLFGEDRYLVTSPEYHMKRLLAAGAPAIYQLCKVWRDGERGVRHRPEFTMLEWYRPFADYHALMADCEAWLLELAGTTSLTYRGRQLDLTPPWRRLTFREALRERGGVADPDALSPDEQERVLMDRVEPTLGAECPEFLIEYPISMASLARPKPDDPTVAERVELFVGGLELGNGFSELTDAAVQRERCESENATRRQLGKREYPLDEEFLDALAEGMPPSAGIAVGMDRVVMLLTDAASIDDVVGF